MYLGAVLASFGVRDLHICFAVCWAAKRCMTNRAVSPALCFRWMLTEIDSRAVTAPSLRNVDPAPGAKSVPSYLGIAWMNLE